MEENITLIQKKIALAQSEHAPIIIELMKDIMTKAPIIGKDQWETTVNALTLEIESTMVRNMVDKLESIRQGILHEQS